MGSINSTSYIEHLVRNILNGVSTTVYDAYKPKLDNVLIERNIQVTRLPTKRSKSKNRHRIYNEIWSYRLRGQ